ncbi:MAG: DUF421 domain-containing protein [Alicyclobacillus sp.]|nr:DUF421 domain-containing protein [Alicyclobacillus sp.]
MHISWFLLTVNTLVTFALLLVLVRWIGSTQLTQLTYFNWVAGASMGNIAANMMAARSWNDWLSAGVTLVVFTAATILAAFVALKSRSFRRVSTGEPIVLIHKGVLLRENLRKTKVNLDVLMMMLREKGYFAYDEIEYGILEPTGNLSILPVQEAQSVSKRDLAKGPDLSPEGQGPYVEIVVDGEIDRDKLNSTGRDEAWLMREIRKRGGRGLEDVMYLAVNPEGQVIADLHRRDAAGRQREDSTDLPGKRDARDPQEGR